MKAKRSQLQLNNILTELRVSLRYYPLKRVIFTLVIMEIAPSVPIQIFN